MLTKTTVYRTLREVLKYCSTPAVVPLTSPIEIIVQEPKDKKKVRSPLIVEFGNPVDQNVHSCHNRFWPGDISRKAQETQN